MRLPFIRRLCFVMIIICRSTLRSTLPYLDELISRFAFHWLRSKMFPALIRLWTERDIIERQPLSPGLIKYELLTQLNTFRSLWWIEIWIWGDTWANSARLLALEKHKIAMVEMRERTWICGGSRAAFVMIILSTATADEIPGSSDVNRWNAPGWLVGMRIYWRNNKLIWVKSLALSLPT